MVNNCLVITHLWEAVQSVQPVFILGWTQTPIIPSNVYIRGNLLPRCLSVLFSSLTSSSASPLPHSLVFHRDFLFLWAFCSFLSLSCLGRLSYSYCRIWSMSGRGKLSPLNLLPKCHLGDHTAAHEGCWDGSAALIQAQAVFTELYSLISSKLLLGHTGQGSGFSFQSGFSIISEKNYFVFFNSQEQKRFNSSWNFAVWSQHNKRNQRLLSV